MLECMARCRACGCCRPVSCLWVPSPGVVPVSVVPVVGSPWERVWDWSPFSVNTDPNSQETNTVPGRPTLSRGHGPSWTSLLPHPRPCREYERGTQVPTPGPDRPSVSRGGRESTGVCGRRPQGTGWGFPSSVPTPFQPFSPTPETLGL